MSSVKIDDASDKSSNTDSVEENRSLNSATVLPKNSTENYTQPPTDSIVLPPNPPRPETQVPLLRKITNFSEDFVEARQSFSSERRNNRIMAGISPSLGIGAILAGIGILVAAVCLYCSAVTVDAGHAGVVKVFGAVQMEALNPGLHWVTPFITTVHQFDTRITSVTHHNTASSKDLQTISTSVSVQYHISASLAPSLIDKVGPREAVETAIISPAIQESVKAITARYAAEQLLTKRDEVKMQISAALEKFIVKTLKAKGVQGGISIANVAITDFAFSAEFNRAIEMKVKTQQEALQAKNEKLRRVTQAEAALAETKLAADAEAYKIEKQATARANAIKKEAASLKSNPELIQLRLAEKWDGVLPQFTGGQGSSMLLDVSQIMNTKSREVRKQLEHQKRSG